MAVDILIPRLGTYKTDAILTEWRVSEGTRVEHGEIVAGIETEKITFELEAEASGFLHIKVAEGTQCPVGMVVGVIAASPEELAELQTQKPADVSGGTQHKLVPGPESIRPLLKVEHRESVRISPVARKLAEEHSIDVNCVAGTGPSGRIVRQDIEMAIAAKAETSPNRTVESEHEFETIDGKRVRQTMPLKGMRGTIAERMRRSLAESAQLSAMGEIDMSQCIALRRSLVDREMELGTRITYTDICVFIVARVLQNNPIINSSIMGHDIKIWDDINIGIATAVADGLIVPVIKKADRQSLVQISKAGKVLAEKARSGRLIPDDVTGGTFTITNLGAAGAGYRFETSIINPPESAVLGIGGISDRAVVRDGRIVIRPIMTYGFTYDHRAIDGTTALRFMAQVIELFENPGLLILDVNASDPRNIGLPNQEMEGKK